MMSNAHDEPATDLRQKVQGLFLGAAVGDALGWPQEFVNIRSGTRGRKRLPYEASSFRPWTKHAGGRYWPHQLEILPGEYSDDTQLLLCTARSLRLGANWWRHFTKCELTGWLLYERGGGRASKSAARCWLAGTAPWSAHPPKERHAYFDAGGNGVAMRIAPHCVRGATAESFAPLAAAIVADGICTHGHPRALVGALAYGFGVWTALRLRQKLPYGGIVNALLQERHMWARLPHADELEQAGMPLEEAQTWRRSVGEAQLDPGATYKAGWDEVVDELVLALRRCQEALEEGALADNGELLRELGCFDRNRNGAGTVCAAAATYLASVFAADPLNGLVEAAFAYGADTDTLASMTGGLLGAVNGMEWLGALAEDVQDAVYLRDMGACLLAGTMAATSPDTAKVTTTSRASQADLDRVVARLKDARQGAQLALPDGRYAVLIAAKPSSTGSPTVQAEGWKLQTDDGQRLYVTKVGKAPRDAGVGRQRQPKQTPSSTEGSRPVVPNTLFHADSVSPQERPGRIAANMTAAGHALAGGPRQLPVAVLMAVILPVEDMRRTREFYAGVLRLAVSLARNGSLRVGGAVSFKPTGPAADGESRNDRRSNHQSCWGNGQELNLQTDEVDMLYQRVQESGAQILDILGERSGRRTFRCLDPDGYVVRVYDERPEPALPDPAGPHQAEQKGSGAYEALRAGAEVRDAAGRVDGPASNSSPAATGAAARRAEEPGPEALR